ncbi:hypothetical protein RchiOBHm_Chr5g0032941 [Rosa chinensis]|uniref:Uncharacterized protein n=1 Tax=Rosa chinensis TaxID=74649 RepID=A0A2P6QAJ6_ROSCH|nr:hypothetical protein RchiOBHm_Chr5g0032941 [Rosa chinensis]
MFSSPLLSLSTLWHDNSTLSLVSPLTNTGSIIDHSPCEGKFVLWISNSNSLLNRAKTKPKIDRRRDPGTILL